MHISLVYLQYLLEFISMQHHPICAMRTMCMFCATTTATVAITMYATYWQSWTNINTTNMVRVS